MFASLCPAVRSASVPAVLSGPVVAVAAAGSLLVAVADFPAHAAVSNTPPEAATRDYESCLGTARSDGEAALALADMLAADGHSRAAAHCRAVAYTTLDRPADAAAALLRLAEQTDADAEKDGLHGDRLRLEAARLFHQAGNPEAARSVLGTIVNGAADPTRNDILMSASLLSADLAWSARDLNAVETSLDRAASIDPDAPAVLVRRAALFRARNNPQAAVDLLARPELETPPPEILLERGLANLDTGRLPAARADWVRLIALYPDSAAANAARRNLDRLEATLESLDTGRTVDPDRGETPGSDR